MPVLDVIDPISPGSRKPAVIFTETSNFVPAQGFLYHQLDLGTANTGTVAVWAKWGTQKRLLATVDMTDASRKPVIVFGNIEEIELVPAGVTGNISFSYVAGRV